MGSLIKRLAERKHALELTGGRCLLAGQSHFGDQFYDGDGGSISKSWCSSGAQEQFAPEGFNYFCNCISKDKFVEEKHRKNTQD